MNNGFDFAVTHTKQENGWSFTDYGYKRQYEKRNNTVSASIRDYRKGIELNIFKSSERDTWYIDETKFFEKVFDAKTYFDAILARFDKESEVQK